MNETIMRTMDGEWWNEWDYADYCAATCHRKIKLPKIIMSHCNISGVSYSYFIFVQ